MFPEVMLGKGTTSVVPTTHQIFRALTNASSFVEERRFGAAKMFLGGAALQRCDSRVL